MVLLFSLGTHKAPRIFFFFLLESLWLRPLVAIKCRVLSWCMLLLLISRCCLCLRGFCVPSLPVSPPGSFSDVNVLPVLTADCANHSCLLVFRYFVLRALSWETTSFFCVQRRSDSTSVMIRLITTKKRRTVKPYIRGLSLLFLRLIHIIMNTTCPAPHCILAIPPPTPNFDCSHV